MKSFWPLGSVVKVSDTRNAFWTEYPRLYDSLKGHLLTVKPHPLSKDIPVVYYPDGYHSFEYPDIRYFELATLVEYEDVW